MGPASAAQARARRCRVTASSWRTWPQRKLRRNVPRVDAALTAKRRTLAVRPAPRAPASIGTALRCTAASLNGPTGGRTMSHVARRSRVAIDSESFYRYVNSHDELTLVVRGHLSLEAVLNPWGSETPIRARTTPVRSADVVS